MVIERPSGGDNPRNRAEYVCWHVASNTLPEVHAAVTFVAEASATDSRAGNMKARPGAIKEGAADASVCTRF